jgi:uncharacterized membrane protein (UPF0127 family)
MAVLLVFPAYAAPVTFSADTVNIWNEAGERHPRSFKVEIAATRKQQEHGLMFRKTLPEDTGMLFLFPKEQKIGMWMKNTLVPLDMLFIDNNGKISQIVENTEPGSLKVIASKEPSRAVLELPAGTCKKHGIQIGESVGRESLSNRLF